MFRLSRGVVVVLVLVLWCSAAGPGCKRARPGPCPKGYSETQAEDRGIWCKGQGEAQGSSEARSDDGAEVALYLELHAKGGPIRQRCQFTQGRPEGPFEAWHENGKPWITGQFAGGRVDGTWVQWDPSGRKVAQGEYRQGRIVQGAPVAIAAVCPQLTPP